MGVAVEVDSDDLETLLFATGVVKNLEAALIAAKSDQQWLEAQPRIATAIDRVAHAWRAAKKPRDPQITLTPSEEQMLMGLAKRGAAEIDGMPVEDAHVYRHMMAKGLVKIGVHQHRLVWNTDPTPEYVRDAQLRLKLTDLAITLLKPLEDKPNGKGRGWFKRFINGRH